MILFFICFRPVDSKGKVFLTNLKSPGQQGRCHPTQRVMDVI